LGSAKKIVVGTKTSRRAPWPPQPCLSWSKRERPHERIVWSLADSLGHRPWPDEGPREAHAVAFSEQLSSRCWSRAARPLRRNARGLLPGRPKAILRSALGRLRRTRRGCTTVRFQSRPRGLRRHRRRCGAPRGKLAAPRVQGGEDVRKPRGGAVQEQRRSRREEGACLHLVRGAEGGRRCPSRPGEAAGDPRCPSQAAGEAAEAPRPSRAGEAGDGRRSRSQAGEEGDGRRCPRGTVRLRRGGASDRPCHRGHHIAAARAECREGMLEVRCGTRRHRRQRQPCMPRTWPHTRRSRSCCSRSFLGRPSALEPRLR
jgi:hypothetical protein